MFRLYDHQLEAIKKMHNGCILCGDVGSGKSLTALGYYYVCNDGILEGDEYIPMSDPPLDLYIITTARKRDSLEWEGELTRFLLSTDYDVSLYSNKVVIDSWNNIGKYKNVTDAFFLFDEQRVVGYGEWAKTFINIARHNKWVLLSATPGDKWEDYMAVFIANGFYRNKTEFVREHLVYSRYVKYKVDRYVNTGRLVRLRNRVLIDMECQRKTIPHHEDIFVNYDIKLYKDTIRNRWDPFKNEPIMNASGLCYILRKITNIDESRQVALMELLEKHPRAIIFYNFDYELDILKKLYYGEDVEIAEWNGHKHQPVPTSKNWIYLVQYSAGCEAWNCITTNTIIFYSQNYSYKILHQAAGRINRMNTPYIDLYYYHLKSRSSIDVAITKSIKNKKKFNERRFCKWD